MSQEITADTIRDLFASQNIKCKGSRSSKDKMFRDLAAEVNFLHFCFERGSVIARQAQSKIEQYLEGLLQEIPTVIQTNIRLAEIQDRYGESSAQMANEQRDRLVQLQRAAQGVMETGIGWRVFPTIEMWHDFAVPLSDHFRKEMHSIDRNLDLQLSNGGPIAKFLEAAVPLITNETQTPSKDAIARHLQREKKEGNTTEMPASRVEHQPLLHIRQG